MSTFPYPEPANAGGLSYAPGSEERRLLKEALAEAEKSVFKIPTIVNGERIYSGRKSYQVNPWNRRAPLAEYHGADQETVEKAIAGSLAARKKWASLPFSPRAAVYKRAAQLVEGKYRWKIMAATMIGQGKTCGQAEGDCIAEVIDTLNFHVYFCHQLYQQQPPKQTDSAYSSLDYRPLEGFILAISPFNFTALGAHIAFTPAILGNVILWKPSPMAVLSNYLLYQIFEEAGLPSGVVQRSPASWIRSAYEFQGQKCSALSRLFVPKSLWEKGDLKKSLLREAAKFTHGDDIKQIHHPLGPIVSEAAFNRFGEFIQQAKKEGHELIYGGRQDGSKGFFLQPAIFEVNPSDQSGESDLMTKEIFGPLFAVQTYDDASPTGFEDVCDLIDRTTEYGLAGAVFSRDRYAVQIASDRLRDSVGMLVINDKCTGAVIGANPFEVLDLRAQTTKPTRSTCCSGSRAFEESFVTGSTTLSACHTAE
ncbi:hypothetical protein NW765_007202 [Fusarium oxysporum]|nr:hypothetical protein NW765_007202 [Fusarium oxysporum]